MLRLLSLAAHALALVFPLFLATSSFAGNMEKVRLEDSPFLLQAVEFITLQSGKYDRFGSECGGF